MICVGVLTLGHVPPEGVERMLDVVRSGGLLALNAREAYVKEQNFEDYCDHLVERELVEVNHKEYSDLIGDSNALYMVLQKI